MAFLKSKDDPDANEPTGGAALGSALGMSGSDSAPGASGPNQGTGFINPSTYQQANQVGASGMAQGLRSDIESQAARSAGPAGDRTSLAGNAKLLGSPSGLATALGMKYGPSTGQQYSQGQQNLDAQLTGQAGGRSLAGTASKYAEAANPAAAGQVDRAKTITPGMVMSDVTEGDHRKIGLANGAPRPVTQPDEASPGSTLDLHDNLARALRMVR